MRRKASAVEVLALALAMVFFASSSCNNSSDDGGGGKKCTNQCSTSGAKECSGNGYHVCGNYDADKCLEWSDVTACDTGETCTDGVCSTNGPTWQKIGGDVRITK